MSYTTNESSYAHTGTILDVSASCSINPFNGHNHCTGPGFSAVAAKYVHVCVHVHVCGGGGVVIGRVRLMYI